MQKFKSFEFISVYFKVKINVNNKIFLNLMFNLCLCKKKIEIMGKIYYIS